jgi:hypothetical protein
MFFSYNDCDTVLGAQMAEEGKRTWMTKKILKNLFDQIGFKLLEFGHKEGIYHWAEIKKPGRLKSRKVDQPRATIQRRKGFEEVDNEEPIKYNNQQIARIKQLAIQLGIDSPEAIMSDQYDIHGLMHLVNIARTKK